MGYWISNSFVFCFILNFDTCPGLTGLPCPGSIGSYFIFYLFDNWDLLHWGLSSEPTSLVQGLCRSDVLWWMDLAVWQSDCSLVLIFLSPRQTNRSFLSSGGMSGIMWYQAQPGLTSLLSLLSRMTSDLLSVNLSKSHCKCFQVKISFQKRHKKPPPCVCSNILRSSPTQHVGCDTDSLQNVINRVKVNRFIFQRYFAFIHFSFQYLTYEILSQILFRDILSYLCLFFSY